MSERQEQITEVYTEIQQQRKRMRRLNRLNRTKGAKENPVGYPKYVKRAMRDLFLWMEGVEEILALLAEEDVGIGDELH